MNEKAMVEREKTYASMTQALDEFGMCSVVRPTSFGKTVLLMRYASEHKDKKCVLVEPRDSKIEELKRDYSDLDNVEYTTYHACRRSRLKNLISKISKDTVFMFDESHSIGSELMLCGWQAFIEKCLSDGAKVIGTTASGIRTDGINVTNNLFCGLGVYEYGIDKAIEDEVLVRPSYYTGVLVEDSLEKQLKTKYKSYVNNKTITKLKRVSNLGENLRQVVEMENLGNKNYYQFLIFYRRIQQIEDERARLAKQLKEAFPGYKINILAVTSEHAGCTDKLLKLKPKDRVIDVIASVDMLRECFHLPYLTGAVMLRHTQSWVVYEQQVGRIITDNMDRKMFMLDLVGNADTDFKANPICPGPPKAWREKLAYINFKSTPMQQDIVSELKKVQMNIIENSEKYETIKTNVNCLASIYKANKKADIVAVAKNWGFSNRELYNVLHDNSLLDTSDTMEGINTDNYDVWARYMKSKVTKKAV